MTANATILRKKPTGDVITDLFCGGLFKQSDFQRLQNASINNRVMSRTKNPEHMTFVVFHNPMRSHSGMFRFVSNINYPIFATARRFTSLRQIRIFFVESRRQSIAPVFRPTILIVSFHRFGVHIFEAIRLSLTRFQNTPVRAVFTNRAAVFRTNKFFRAKTANNGCVFPVRQ